MSKTLKPEFEEGFVEIPITYEDIFALIKTLEYSEAAFEHLYKQALAEGDPDLADVFKARSEMSRVFANKLSAVAKVGQPSDSNRH